MDLPRHVDKPWGHELWYAVTDRYVGKILHVEARPPALAAVPRRQGRVQLPAVGQGEAASRAPAPTTLTETVVEAGHTWRNRPGEIHTIEALETPTSWRSPRRRSTTSCASPTTTGARARPRMSCVGAASRCSPRPARGPAVSARRRTRSPVVALSRGDVRDVPRRVRAARRTAPPPGRAVSRRSGVGTSYYDLRARRRPRRLDPEARPRRRRRSPRDRHRPPARRASSSCAEAFPLPRRTPSIGSHVEADGWVRRRRQRPPRARRDAARRGYAPRPRR